MNAASAFVQPSGETVAHGALPEKALSAMYRRLAFTAVDTSPAWAYDSVKEWTDVTERVQDALYSAIRTIHGGDGLREEEHDQAAKNWVCWRDRGYGTLVQPAPLYVDNAAQASTLRRAFRRRGDLYSSALYAAGPSWARDVIGNATVPVRRGKGAPYWFAAQDMTVVPPMVHTATRRFTLQQLLDRYGSMGGAAAPIALTGLIRLQENRKATQAYAIDTGRLLFNGYRTGPKVRKIQALPFPFNIVLTPLAAVTRALMEAVSDRHTGTLGPAQALARKYRYAVAIDIANFDDSNAYQTLNAYFDAVSNRLARQLVEMEVMPSGWDMLVAELNDHLNYLPLYTPPTDVSFAATLMRRAGGIVSGKRTTSTEGTDINDDLQITRRELQGLDYVHCNLGDDTIGFTNDAHVAQTLATPTSFAGYRMTTGPAATFLARDVRRGCNYLARMIRSCINREPNKEPLTLASAASSIAIRRLLLKGHPVGGAFDGILLAGQSRRLTAAVKLSQAVSWDRLAVMAMAEGTLRGDAYDEYARDIARLVERGVQPSADVLAALEGLRGREHVRYSELTVTANKMSEREAASIIRGASYTSSLSFGRPYDERRAA